MTTVSARPGAPARYHPWVVFCCRRAARLVVSLFVVVTASFAMIRLIPGDPVRAALGVDAPPDLVAAERHELGLDRSLPEQYVQYLPRLAHGDLGVSLVTGEPVAELVRARLPATLLLAVLAFGCVLVVALPGGVLAAVWTRGGRRPRTELVFTATTSVLAGVPDFVLAAGLTAGLAVALRILPAAGDLGSRSYVLPVLALALAPTAVLLRIVRVETLKVLATDYVRAARAKRLPAVRFHVCHVAPNALTASLTFAGNLLPALIAGTVLVEKVFAWPGIGSAMAQSVVAQDYAVVEASVLVLGSSVLLVNFLVDLALALLDPRSVIRKT
ncbi:ABC transporter permease [Streptomyces fuscichromogenes]|uniref:Peptide ABC transporter permease n=1 Tax=Streptomyces fuscichromogenes TaxID=1324013 RepID=A0A917XK90_9ACTN|nr:ABC transporter permease [Streptomyces fuscichromogenes]GGN33986.1 peptide ABC transporter permease [Streptomyces fuscichromogenes]